jgi:hypothetical protein
MYTKAEKPDDIHVRVLQQNDPEVDVDCFKEYCHLMSMRDSEGDDDIEKDEKEYLDSCPYKDQIFIHDIHAKEAAGPTWARGLISKDLEEAHRQQSLSAQVSSKRRSTQYQYQERLCSCSKHDPKYDFL